MNKNTLKKLKQIFSSSNIFFPIVHSLKYTRATQHIRLLKELDDMDVRGESDQLKLQVHGG